MRNEYISAYVRRPGECDCARVKGGRGDAPAALYSVCRNLSCYRLCLQVVLISHEYIIIIYTLLLFTIFILNNVARKTL